MTMQPSIIPQNSSMWPVFESLATNARIVVFTGIPGVGKSLLVQQLAQLAANQGRLIQTLQWDVARLAFETPPILARYPEIDGFTDPMLRRAVGYWARSAICAWNQRNPELEHLLIVEAPLIGGRLIELTTPPLDSNKDATERVLQAENTHFVVPVPSLEVRHVIEQARVQSIAHPRHKREHSDAQVNVLQSVWHDVAKLAADLGLLRFTKVETQNYDPGVYSSVFSHLLRDRNPLWLDIDIVLAPQRSVYDFDIEIGELLATAEEVEDSFRVLESKRPPT